MVRCAFFVIAVCGFGFVSCGVDPKKMPGDEVLTEHQHEMSTGGTITKSPSEVAAYDCEDGSYVVAEYRPDGDDVALFLPEETVFLPHIEAASGARYGDEGVTFWSKGHEAMVERDGVAVNCIENGPASVIERAKLGGADFWATGNEPGWTLEIHSDRLVLVTNYGELRIDVPVGPPVVDDEAGTAVFSSVGSEHEVTVTLCSGRCADDMSGREYETTVELMLDGTLYRGCGQALH